MGFLSDTQVCSVMAATDVSLDGEGASYAIKINIDLEEANKYPGDQR